MLTEDPGTVVTARSPGAETTTSKRITNEDIYITEENQGRNLAGKLEKIRQTEKLVITYQSTIGKVRQEVDLHKEKEEPSCSLALRLHNDYYSTYLVRQPYEIKTDLRGYRPTTLVQESFLTPFANSIRTKSEEDNHQD